MLFYQNTVPLSSHILYTVSNNIDSVYDTIQAYRSIAITFTFQKIYTFQDIANFISIHLWLRTATHPPAVPGIGTTLGEGFKKQH